MRTSKQSIVLAAAFTVLVLTLLFMDSRQATAQNQGRPEVTIAAPLPLPVTGTVNVGNLPGVPALTPFRGSVSVTVNFINAQQLLTTVPAGQRLVLQHISYWTFGPDSDELVFGSLRNGQFGPNAVMLPINPPHRSATPGLSIQDYSSPVTAYFEPGEEVWVSVSKSGGPNRTFEGQFSGYFIRITP